ncbi:RidA family protein [Nonomuraea phyllanthi]|uniref:RidA family protein n=1 Tax=Nonomuraea phyllanthi TaxID=2219224 RepID=UPI00129330A8|nr:Rid family hydrolase [Nonomuraea phyllanthi]QFY07800.1 RidA family protein [Nonomuraea phyllanthi]
MTDHKKVGIHTDQAPPPRGAYSQAVVVGDLVYTAGFGPVDPVTRAIVGADVAEQTRQTLRNVAAALVAAGSHLRDVVKVTAHLADIDNDWDGFDTAYREFFDEPRPARTTAGSSLGGILVEIDVVAVKGSGG